MSRAGSLLLACLIAACGRLDFENLMDSDGGAGGSDAAQNVTVWTATRGGLGDEIPNGATADVDGNVYVVGTTNGPFDGEPFGGGQDMFITKYDRHGVHQWTRIRGGTGDEDGARVIVASDGSVFVTGGTTGSTDGQIFAGGVSDIALWKFDAAGTWQWTRLRGGSGQEGGSGIGLKPNGNLVVTGATLGSLDGSVWDGSWDADYVEWDPDGNYVTTQVSGGMTQGSTLQSMQGGTVDAAGNVIVVGYTQPFDTWGLIMKWPASGPLLWDRARGGGGTSLAGPVYGNVVADSDGSLYIGGIDSTPLDGETGAGLSDVALIKYNANGDWQWSRLHGGPADENAWPNVLGIASSSSGLFVAGFTTASIDSAPYSGGTSDMFLMKWDKAGSWQWTEMHGNGTGNVYVTKAICADRFGGVLVAGTTDRMIEGQPVSGGRDLVLFHVDGNH